MKRITPNEAKHIVLTYLMGYASASMTGDCDFYEEIPHNYILDESKLESSMLEHIGMYNKEYYPNEEDIKVIAKEFEKVFYQLLHQKQTCIKKYNKHKEQTCQVCGNTYLGEDPKMCCSGRDCGCLGQPIEPMVCSEKCYNNLPNNIEKNESKEK